MSALRPEPPPVRPAIVHLVYLAAVVMGLSAVVHLAQGVAVLRGDELLRARPTYFGGDPGAAWGWLHLIVGIVLAATAIGVLRGSPRALAYAAGITIVAAMTSFVTVPFYPAWGIVGLVLNGTALYAIATVGTTGHWAKGRTAQPPRHLGR